MLVACINQIILAIALPSLRISPLLLIRIATIVLVYAAVLYLSVVYIQSIGSGIANFSGLFPVTLLGQNKAKVNEEFIELPPFLDSYSDLSNPLNIKLVRENYKDKMIVYGIYNNVTNQIYIGSSIEPSKRVYNHLISARDSNVYLQGSINKYGLSSFTFVVFSVLEVSKDLTKLEKKDLIIPLEQKYLDMFPKSQLYNFLYVADSKLGSVHSEKSKLLMSVNSIGKNLGNIPANKGKKLSELERINLISGMRHRFKAIYFYDDMMNLVSVYESFNTACLYEKCSKSTLQASLSKNTLFRGFKVSFNYPLNQSY